MPRGEGGGATPSTPGRLRALTGTHIHPRPPRRHCLLLSRMALQSSAQDCSRLCCGLVATCLLWQAVNSMCSHAGLGSTPDWEKSQKELRKRRPRICQSTGWWRCRLRRRGLMRRWSWQLLKGCKCDREDDEEVITPTWRYAILFWTRHFPSSSPLISRKAAVYSNVANGFLSSHFTSVM